VGRITESRIGTIDDFVGLQIEDCY
jgi:hypothetical protein